MSAALLGASASAAILGPHTNATAAEPDTFRVGFAQKVESLNPFSAVLSVEYWMFAHVYDLLVGIGPDLEAVPQLAKSWSVASDQLTWTFDLQENVTWHDGTPFTANDVKFTIEYIQGCQLSLFLGYVGDPTSDPVYIESVQVINPARVVMVTNVPKSNMLSLFVFMLPEHIWSAIACADAETTSNDAMIGTGFYKFVRWQQGSFVELSLNDDYYLLPGAVQRKPGMDFVETIFMQFYTDTLPLYNDFRAGELDATDALTSRQFAEVSSNLDGDPEPDVSKFTYDLLSFSEIGFCVASDATIQANEPPNISGRRHWLMTNLTVRQAITMGIDKQSILDNAYQGFGRTADSLIPPATPFWHYDVPAANEYSFNLTKAAALLNDPQGDGFTLRSTASSPGLKGEGLDPAAGNNVDAFADVDNDGVREVVDLGQVFDDVDQDGFTDATAQGNQALGTAADELDFGIWIIDAATEQQTAADIFIPWLASIGIAVQKVIVSEGQQIDVSYAADYDLYMWGFGGDVDPDFLLSVLTTDQILGWQDAWYSNPDYDAMYTEQQGLINAAERQTVIREMQRIAYRDQPYLVYLYPLGTTAVRSDRFTDWGDWAAHPGLGLSGFGNAFLMLQLEPFTAPTSILGNPLVLGGVAAVIIVIAAVGVVLLLRSRRKRNEMISPPMPPSSPPMQPPGPPPP